MSGTFETDAVTVVIESLGDDPGLEIIDPIERRRYTLATPDPVRPQVGDPDRFRYPVETTVTIETSALSLPVETLVYVRDTDGRMLAEIEHGTERTFPDGEYSLELNRLVKTYLRVDTDFSIYTTESGTEIRFDETTELHVGVRSLHERPGTTITTTGAPADLMRAISAFSSALKTTSPERSFPTLRGHPPRVTIGEELSIPEALQPPSETIRIEVPPTLEYVYPVAPLSYYLGARIEEGPRPRIVGAGIDYYLDEDAPFETAVERTLKQVFLLDCVTRTEGLYRVDLYERRQVEPEVDLEFGELYELPQGERLSAYLEEPYETIERYVPDWKLAAHVDPVPETAELLPYLIDDLAVVRTARSEPVSATAVDTGAAQSIYRSSAPSSGDRGEQSGEAGHDSEKVHYQEPTTDRGSTRGRGAAAGRGTSHGRGTATMDEEFVVPTEGINAIEEAWASDGTPLKASKAIPEAYENRLGRTPSRGQIDIAVVCNAEVMAGERDVVDDVYGSREDLPFDVTVYHDTTRDEFAALMTRRRDFVHFIGHIDSDGFRCDDGRFDVTDLDHVGPDAFFFNACQSYNQGMEMIRGGAIGGIVTLSDVVNHGAIRIGRAVARLLNAGFPLKSALDIAREETVIGSQYIVVGDGSLSVVQPESGTPVLCVLDRVDDDGYELQINPFGAEPGMGSMFFPYLEENEAHYLSTGGSRTFRVDDEQLEDFLQLENIPVRVDDRLRWSGTVIEKYLRGRQ